MNQFATMRLPTDPVTGAPEGSGVRFLLGLSAGSMAHFRLGAGQVAKAITHRTVEEIWFIVAGRGEMWRKQGEHEETVLLEPGVCLTIPLGTHFQFRASATEAFSAIGITMPPWLGKEEAVHVAGPWLPSSR
jgi:mannose-6-phosphate isomerase-like protein (cupin superfamily)